MTVATEVPKLPLWQRLFFAVPVIGWIARDVAFGDSSNIWFALIFYVSLWMCSALTFGLPGLYLPALAMVPIIFVLLLAITWG
ncbi:hypothetical protein [Roseobacter ponti]|uniref:Uncharacterized protein n=1 Tax=Roseobacter ponti TaxID=1891787 RepID=A0A858SUP6_9RHOB|nr:hypothetical protein [Roseobacter ponti]QJF52010.1 hypothetical protein G3256_12965 [Roseobacter ponti]